MSKFDEERLRYRDMVDKQRDAIIKLLDLSSSHYGLFENAMINQLHNCKEKCDKLYRKLDKDEFEIAIVGLEKAGKSTFGNALMQNRILPDADERCTYTSTCIRYGNDRAVVKFFNSSEMDTVLRGYLQTLGIKNTESFTFSLLDKFEYMNLFDKLDERDKGRYESTVHQDILNLLENKNEIQSYIGQPERIFEGNDLYEDKFKSFIVSPKVAVAVKEVSIESSKLEKLKNAVIYDVPGFDSPTSMHLEQTKNRMKEADAIMLVASAEKPSFTAPALKMFQEVVDEDNVSLSDKLFIFGNRADGATTLSKNISTLKQEAIKWKLLNNSMLDERVIVGSAKAHLQKVNVVAGDDLVKKIESPEYKSAWHYGDGIQHTHDKLIKYNIYERFPIVKKKVRRNNEELREIIQSLKDRYSDNGIAIDGKKLLFHTTELIHISRKSIQMELEKLRDDIRKRYPKELILSKRLQSEITRLFEEDKYLVVEKDIEEEHLKNDGIGININIEKAEVNIREKKFEQIYADFSKSAFAVAQHDHAEYYQQIVDSFEKALDINKKNSNYEKLHEMVKEFIKKYRKDCDDDFIYQSLIERFVSDIVEMLIKHPYSHESRLRKFIIEAEVFSGLVMFYNPGDADQGFKRQFLSVAPKNQPLLLALVFHNYKKSDEVLKNAIAHINTINKGLSDNSEIIQLVFSVIKQDPIGGFDALQKLVQKEKEKNIKTDENISSILSSLRALLRRISDEGEKENNSSTKKYNFDFTNEKIFEMQYKQFFGNMPPRDYSNIIEFFKEDLEILQKFLIHASIPAIRLEKPFVAREVQSINNILKSVASVEFDNMINQNSTLLMPMVYKELNTAFENSMANKLAVKEVERIMDTLNSSETA